MDIVGDTFVYQPCSPDCEYWIFTRDECKKSGREIGAILDPNASQKDIEALGL
jgi:hypothetical protein